MKTYKKKIGVFICALVLFSCAPADNDNKNHTKSFWAVNINDNKPYSLKAELLVTGKYCNVWAEKAAYVDRNTAQAIANEYDNVIYFKVVSLFSNKKHQFDGYNATTMEYADFYFGDDDGKLCILLLDIKDSYSSTNNAYVAGYFYPDDFFGNNKCDMIYIDTNPGLRNLNTAYRTLAHELQHLINLTTSIVVRWSVNKDGGNNTRDPKIKNYLMDTWIDEGLSESAEWVYDGHSSARVNWFNNDPTGLIGKGNNFFIWGNHTSKHPNAVLDDYATVYLFFQWLRLQANDNPAIYMDTLISKNPNYLAVIEAIDKYNASDKYNNWDTLLKTWLAANYIKSNDNKYGYRYDTLLKLIKTPSIPKDLKSIPLYPGEGVYSSITSAFTPPNAGIGPNIKYAGLSSSSITNNYSGSVLLTYNSSTNGITYSGNNIVIPGAENGTTTGTPLPPSVSVVSGRSASGEVKGPHRIGINDMLMRNGTGRNFLIGDFSGFNREE